MRALTLNLRETSRSTRVKHCALLSFLTLVLGRSLRAEERSNENGSHLRVRNPNWLIDYQTKHASGLKRLRRGEHVNALVYTCHGGCGGLGDRLSGMLSAFYVAVATERIFLIDHTHPVDLNLTLSPSSIDWNAAYLVRDAPSATVQLIDPGDPMRSFGALLENALVPSTKVLRLQINRFYVGMALWTPKLERQPRGHAYDYVGYMHRLNGNALETKEVFHLAFHALFTFSRNVELRAADMMKEMGLQAPDGSAYVAIHARMGGSPQSSAGAVTWTDPERHSLNDVGNFLSCARSKTVSNTVFTMSKGDTPILVFSDSKEFQQAAANMDEHVRFVKSTVLFHVDRSSENSDLVVQGNIDTYSELYIMAHAGCIVGSHSTLSAIAATVSMSAYDATRCFCIFNSCQQDTLDFFEVSERSKLVF